MPNFTGLIMCSKKRLMLISPTSQHLKGFALRDNTKFPPIGLGIIASLTPEHWDIQLIDENFDKFEFVDADLVGITAFSVNAPRAYDIASVYRKKGIPVVMGGIHASMMIDEALEYVDTVVKGEAESIWPTVIADFEAGELKSFYQGEYLDMKNAPKPRVDLFSDKYIFGSVQTSRGCPMDCSFCSVTAFNGHKYRERPVEEVLDEIELSKDKPYLFFVDDHIVNNSKRAQQRAIDIFKGMVDRGLQRNWFCQASLNVADNEEVLKWAHKSGCYMILTGIESEKPEALQSISKRRNLSRGVSYYQTVFKKMHKYKIAALGTFIFGLETDEEKDILARRDFILKCGVDVVQASILTPLPGTSVFKRAMDEKRLISDDLPQFWERLHFMEVTMKPAKIEVDRMKALMSEVYRSIYCKENLRRMMFRTLIRTRSFRTAYLAYSTNINYGRLSLENEIMDENIDGLDMNMEWKNKPRSNYLRRTDWIFKLFYLTFLRKFCE